MVQKTLMDVFAESLDDADFREALLNDHRTALKSKDWELPEPDLTQLDEFMKYDQKVDADTVLKWFGSVASGCNPPPPPLWKPIHPFREMS